MGSIGHIKNRVNTGEIYERFTELFHKAREVCDNNPNTLYTPQDLADIVCTDPKDRRMFSTVLDAKDFPAGDKLFMAPNLTQYSPGQHVIRTWWDKYILHLIERDIPLFVIAGDICEMDPILDKYQTYSRKSIYGMIRFSYNKTITHRPRYKRAYNYYKTRFERGWQDYRQRIITEYSYLKHNPEELDRREKVLSNTLNYLYSVPKKKSIDDVVNSTKLPKEWLMDFFLSDDGRCYSSLLRDFLK